jgi:hypothetical protein
MSGPLFDNSASSLFLAKDPNTSGRFHCQRRALDAQLYVITDIPQVERPSFHLVAILGCNQSFFG